MHIINSLKIQLKTILSLMRKDLESDTVTYNYYVREDDFKFLNDEELNTYLLENKVENSYPLEIVNNLCIEIRNLWNDNLGKKNAKELNEWFSGEKEDGNFFGTCMDFHVLILCENKCHVDKIYEPSTIILKELFSKKYVQTDIHKIVLKCQKIRNLLTSTNNSLISKEGPEQWLFQYQNFKSFKITGKPYKKNDYDNMKMIFEDRVFTSRYIFLKLDKAEQLEFKKHVIENLTEIKEMQILPEFENLLSKVIVQSENDFVIKCNKAEYPFKDSIVLENFKTYTDKFIIDPYVDYSYLFQRLKDSNLIQHITHKNFMMWLKENNYITEKTFDTFLKNQSFRSLNKSTSNQRENNFNNIFSQLH